MRASPSESLTAYEKVSRLSLRKAPFGCPGRYSLELIILIMKIALCIYDLEAPCKSYLDWLAIVDGYAKSSSSANTDLLVLPELVGLHWAHYLSSDHSKPPSEVIRALATDSTSLVSDLTEISSRNKISILAGSFPRMLNQQVVNQAILVGEKGVIATHEKLCLTPIEKKDFLIHPGERLSVFEIQGWRCVILTCLDIEQPWLSCQLSQLDIDLVLVPSMTMTSDGYHRVFSCAKSRAVELQAAVCVVGAVGNTPYTPFHPSNYSGAAVFVPCEEPLGSDGTLLNVAPRATSAGTADAFLHISAIPLAEIRRMRNGGARVWPGAWRPSSKFRVELP
ncbi:nitrilase-related carbon-nitrogen hydrolase [Cupriavidus sp. PET2-C1]